MRHYIDRTDKNIKKSKTSRFIIAWGWNVWLNLDIYVWKDGQKVRYNGFIEPLFNLIGIPQFLNFLVQSQ